MTYTAGGTSAPATITAVTGAGPSGFKTLNLDAEGRGAQTDVLHQSDAAPGAACWHFDGTAEELAEQPADNPWPEHETFDA